MTALDGDLIGVEAVEAFRHAMLLAGGPLGAEDDAVRAGLAAALPHLADALTASQPDRGSSDGAPGGSSRGSVALSGLQGHSAPTTNPPDTTQEDTDA